MALLIISVVYYLPTTPASGSVTYSLDGFVLFPSGTCPPFLFLFYQFLLFSTSFFPILLKSFRFTLLGDSLSFLHLILSRFCKQVFLFLCYRYEKVAQGHAGNKKKGHNSACDYRIPKAMLFYIQYCFLRRLCISSHSSKPHSSILSISQETLLGEEHTYNIHFSVFLAVFF